MNHKEGSIKVNDIKEVEEMKNYLNKKRELNEMAKTKANEAFNKLIFEHSGKTTHELRSAVLRFIDEDNLPEDIAYKLKSKTDSYISKLKIPVQKDWTGK